MKSHSLQSTTLEIRTANQTDTSAIARLIFSAFREHAWVTPPISALGETAESVAVKMRSAMGLIAEIDGRPVACVFYQPLPDPEHMYLSRLAVSPDYRGRGIARRLIAEVERRAIDAGYSRVRLATRCVLEKNVALYERLGYRSYEFGTHAGSDAITTVLMEKRLS